MSLLDWFRVGEPPEAGSLVALCRREAAGSRAAPLTELSDDVRRASLLDLAGEHRVLGLVVSALGRRSTDASWSKEIDALLGGLRRRAAMAELRRNHVLALLRDAALQPVVLKGGALVGSVYPDVWERDLEDLDLLVRKEELRPAFRALKHAGYHGPRSLAVLLGYRRHHFHVPMRHPSSHYVEIHWALARSHWPFQLATRSVLQRARTIRCDGVPDLAVPCPEHMLLHLVLQNLQEGFSRLARVVDIDRIIESAPDLDWELLVHAARNGGLEAPTVTSLRLAQRLLSTPVPREAVRDLRPGRPSSFHLAIMRPVSCLLGRRLRDDYAAKHLFELWLARGLRNRALLLARTLRPDPEDAMFRRDGPGPVRRLLRLGKLLVLQLAVYLAVPVAGVTAGGRAQMRFWSSHASSSDRL